jgi:hypothetical protein
VEGQVRLSELGSFGIAAVLILLGGAGGAGTARAQGEGHEHHGVANNTCPLIAGGMHEMHVAAYHASTGVFEELCVEIPTTGKLTVTLDAVSTEIRDMTTEIKLVKGEGPNLDATPLVHVPPARYPTGVANFTVPLDDPGKYTLLVTLREGQMEMTGTHVFTVTHPLQKWFFVPAAAVAVLAAAGVAYFYNERRKKLQPSRS